MATYDWPELIGLWRRGEIDRDQLTGQALQWGQKVYETVTTCLKRQKTLEKQVAVSQAKQAAQEKQVTALLKRIESLEAQLSSETKP